MTDNFKNRANENKIFIVNLPIKVSGVAFSITGHCIKCERVTPKRSRSYLKVLLQTATGRSCQCLLFSQGIEEEALENKILAIRGYINIDRGIYFVIRQMVALNDDLLQWFRQLREDTDYDLDSLYWDYIVFNDEEAQNEGVDG